MSHRRLNSDYYKFFRKLLIKDLRAVDDIFWLGPVWNRDSVGDHLERYGCKFGCRNKKHMNCSSKEGETIGMWDVHKEV